MPQQQGKAKKDAPKGRRKPRAAGKPKGDGKQGKRHTKRHT